MLTVTVTITAAAMHFVATYYLSTSLSKSDTLTKECDCRVSIFFSFLVVKVILIYLSNYYSN